MAGWSFLHPWLLAGLAAVALPVLVHLIGRRRAPIVRFAAFDFLLAVNKRLASRERLRQILLLLLRTLAIAALVFAVSRPMPEREAPVADVARRLVLVVDTSASMAYVRDGESLLDRAKHHAREVLSHLQPADSVFLVLCGAAVRTPFQNPTLDHSAVRDAIGALSDPQGVADIGAGIDTALQQLGGDGSAATLVVISDLAKNSFVALRPSEIDPPPEVRLLDAADREAPVALGNAAIDDVRLVSQGGGPMDRSIIVTVRNYGSEAVVGRELAITVDGRVLHRGQVDVAPFGSSDKTFTHHFDNPGVYEGAVRLAEVTVDGYRADDVAHFVAHLVPAVSVLAVNGDPRTTPYEDELFFLERALEALPEGQPAIQLRQVTVDELTGLELAGFDVVLLANVGSLPPADVVRLKALVEAGGGLLMSMGERVQFERANETLRDLLPFPLRDRQLVEDPDAGTPPVGIGEVDWEHAILGTYDAALDQGLRASRTRAYFNLGVGAGVQTRPILSFESGAPALVERRLGDGRLVVLTTSIDVDLSDLALRTAFPPLMQRLMRYMADAMPRAGTLSVRAGEEYSLALPTGTRGIAWQAQDGAREELMLDGAGSRRVVRRDVAGVGVHRAQLLFDGWKDAPTYALAVNANLEESDFAPIAAQQVSEALSGDEASAGFAVLVDQASGFDPFDLRGFATYFLLALAAFFVGESMLAVRG